MVIKPIFYQGKLIAWTASSSHTADTGGLLRGGATEIFHEGIRILGLKVVERGEFREDVFKTLVEQCRDPEYVGLDLKSRIAANNVCARRFLQLVERFGPEFVAAAGQKLIRDAEEQARAKLRRLPDGTWRSRLYATTLDPKTRQAQVVQVACAMTKQDDELSIDLTGTGPQMHNDFNSTLPSTLAHVTIALTNQLYWDIPWSDGKMAPVRVSVPEGSILNCRFPAACGFAPWVGQILVAALSECLAKMLYAGGLKDDVNACWCAYWYAGGPGYLYGGHNREGLTTAQGLYDIHGGGLGATPQRDGVDSGGHPNIPSGGISDIERTEMQYPFVYFTRRHTQDGGGFGRWRGGVGPERLLMIHGSQDSSVDFRPYGPIPQGSFGLFGGHPTGFGGTRALFLADGLLERLAAGDYPTSAEAVETDGWGKVSCPAGSPERIPLPEHSIVADFAQSGGGYGDPLDRPAEAVAQDVRTGITSRYAAEKVYGVLLDGQGHPDAAATARRREAIRADRRARGVIRAAESQPPSGPPRRGGSEGPAGSALDSGAPPAGGSVSRSSTAAGPGSLPASGGERGAGQVVLHFHEYLDVVALGDRLVIRCARCGHELCDADDNYKRHALEIREDFEELAGRRIPSGQPYLGEYRAYACPGCATLLQVDTYCPSQGGDLPLWDIQLDTRRLRSRA